MMPSVQAVHARSEHGFSKPTVSHITLLAGQGVEGDAHCGATVKHRSRVARDPSQPNLRQVHLLQAEMLEALQAAGFEVVPGAMGENVTTRGVDLLSLPAGTRLRLGADAEIELTGLRNPCSQIDDFQPGLMAAVLDRTADGRLVRKAGVMAIVLRAGVVWPRDNIVVRIPAGARAPLQPV